MIRKNDQCWIIKNNSVLEQVQVLSVSGNLYTIRLKSGGAIRLPKHRLYESYEAAMQDLKKRKREKEESVNPYLYWH